jgi:hypothetical protein
VIGKGAAAAILVVLTGACTLLVPMDADEFTDGAARDASAPVAPAPETSLVEDGGAQPSVDGDAQSNLDGGSEAGTCGATFCESFDDGPLGDKWGQLQAVNGGELALVPSTIGPPNALRVRLTRLDGGSGTRRAFLAKTFPMPKRARCSLDVFAGPGMAASGDFMLFGLQTKSGNNAHSLELKLKDDAIVLVDKLDGSDIIKTIPASPWTGSWMHVELDVEIGVRASLAALGQQTLFDVRSLPASELVLVVGESGDSESFTYEVLIDNVACTFTP